MPENNEYLSLIERIEDVFGDVPYPGDDDLISTPDHVKACEECGGLHKSLAGKTWREVCDNHELAGELSHAMSFFSAAGWQYYLPAYLIQRVRHRAFSSSDFAPDNDPQLVEYWNRRIERLTVAQCGCVVAYLLIVRQENHGNSYEMESDKEAVEYWKENYQKLLSENNAAQTT